MYPNTSDMENSDKVTKALETLKLELVSLNILFIIFTNIYKNKK